MAESLAWLTRQVAALEAKFMSVATSMVEYVVIANTSADGSLDAVKFPGGGSKSQRRVTRTSPFGLASRPVPGLIAAVLKVGTGALNGLYGSISDFTYAPQDLEEGETCLYAKAGQTVKLHQDGSITLTPATGKTITLAGGTLNIARVSDTAGPYPIVGGNPFVKG